jgi:hypothetical protein
MLTFEFQKLLQNSMVWRPTCFYIVAFVYWNIVYIESCMYKSVLGKNKQITKKTQSFKYMYQSLPLPVKVK